MMPDGPDCKEAGWDFRVPLVAFPGSQFWIVGYVPFLEV